MAGARPPDDRSEDNCGTRIPGEPHRERTTTSSLLNVDALSLTSRLGSCQSATGRPPAPFSEPATRPVDGTERDPNARQALSRGSPLAEAEAWANGCTPPFGVGWALIAWQNS